MWFLISCIEIIILFFIANIYWIYVFQRDRNLLLAGDDDKNLKIFDKGGSKIVRTFDGIHNSKFRSLA